LSIIFKYPLPVSDNLIPAGKPLHVGFQRGALHIWVEHENHMPDGEMSIAVLATGGSFAGDYLEYIGTAVSDEFVWHVYEWTR